MSRPFSYSDENYTVIDNILFVHINIGKKAYAENDVIIAIPPKLFDRMATYNQYSYVSTKEYGSNGFNEYIFSDINGILRITPNIPESSKDKIAYSWFLLKDI